MITESDTIDTRKDGKEIRKSLAVDPATYDLLQQICQMVSNVQMFESSPTV